MVESPFEFKKGSDELSFELWSGKGQSVSVISIIWGQDLKTHSSMYPLKLPLAFL
jgi:hypothetical protein